MGMKHAAMAWAPNPWGAKAFALPMWGKRLLFAPATVQVSPACAGAEARADKCGGKGVAMRAKDVHAGWGRLEAASGSGLKVDGRRAYAHGAPAWGAFVRPLGNAHMVLRLGVGRVSPNPAVGKEHVGDVMAEAVWPTGDGSEGWEVVDDP